MSEIDPTQVHALVVGIESYAFGPEWNLNGPATDALKFIDWLIGQGVSSKHIQFFASPLPENKDTVIAETQTQGIKFKNATRSNIDDYIRNELTTTSQGEVLYVFWGGHGVLTKTQGSTRRLFFSDTTDTNKLNLEIDSLVQALSTSAINTGFSRQIFLIDACANAYFQDLYETTQGEMAGQRYSTTGEDDQAEQFVLFAADEYAVATNTAENSGFFSKTVMTELKSQSLWPDVEAITKRVQASYQSQQKQKPVYRWIKGSGFETIEGWVINSASSSRSVELQQRQQATAKRKKILATAVERSQLSVVKKRILLKRIDKLTAQYEALNEQYDDSLDAEQRVVLQSRISKLEEKIETLATEVG